MPVPVQISFKPIKKPVIGELGYQGHTPGRTEVLPRGWRKHGGRPLESDVKVEHDIEIRVRDGCRLYIDIYRPNRVDKRVPAIVSWSAYGKTYSTQEFIFSRCTWACCLEPQDVSGIEQLEGLDPAWWCSRGYAIINVDARGVNNSDGQIPIMGSQDAEDAYDVIEAVAKMPWCNGKIGMAGNSALAIAQWHVASINPPSLAAIAPWEGCGDLYREQFCRGGLFTMSNFDMIAEEIIRGGSGVEGFEEMYRRDPLSNTYWEDKRPKMKNISIPTFIAGSDFSGIHTMGAIRGFLEVNTDKKWIKWNAFQEWFDLYSDPKSYTELKMFFDRYLRNIDNGWEKTPKVRWTALKFGDREGEQDIVLPDFPVPNTEYCKLYFDDNSAASPIIPEAAGSVSHESCTPGAFSGFTYTFDKPTRIIGVPKAVLYMSCDAQDDLNVYVMIRKLDKSGNPLLHLLYPFNRAPINSVSEITEKDKNSLTVFMGPMGMLRASHRKITPGAEFHPMYPHHPHDEVQKVPAGEVVRMEIGLWAMGTDFEAGESLRVQVHGQFPSITEFGSEYVDLRPDWERNKGAHVVHFGGEHPSHIIVPIV